MFNVKWGAFPAAAAFVIAFILSLWPGHAGLLTAFLRALLFAAIFFALGTGIWFLIRTFIPDLLAPETEADVIANIFGTEAPGSRVNITVGDTKNAALPDGGDIDEVGNIANITTGTAASPDRFKWSDPTEDIDQKPANGYTDSLGEIPSLDNGKTESEFGEFFANFDSFSSDPAGDIFSIADSGSSAKQADEFPPERRVSGNKSEKLEGDFSPKEIAAGIRTVLEKEKKG